MWRCCVRSVTGNADSALVKGRDRVIASVKDCPLLSLAFLYAWLSIRLTTSSSGFVRFNSPITFDPYPAKSLNASSRFAALVNRLKSGQSSGVVRNPTMFSVLPWLTGKVRTWPSGPICVWYQHSRVGIAAQSNSGDSHACTNS